MFGRKGPSTSTWKPGRKQGALITAGVAAVAAAVVVPIPIAAWAAAAIICALWPDPDKPQSFTRQLSQKQDLMGRKAAKIAAQLRKPTATTLGFGDPGNDPYNPDAAEPWPPVRLSAWWSLFGALSLGIAALWIPVPWFCPAPARAVLSVVGAFLLFQCLAAGARAGKDNIEVGPGALLNREDALGVIKERAAGLAAAAALGAIAAVLLFGPSLTWVTRGFAEGFDAAGTVLNSTGGTIPPSTVALAPVAPGANGSTTVVEVTTTIAPTTTSVEPTPQDASETDGDEKGAGVELPALVIAALAAVAAAAAAAAVFSRIYIEEQCEEWADFIAKRDGWQQMWDNINMLAPTYVTTVSLPRSGGPGDPQGETHELNAFVTSNGVTWTDYARAHESIQAALGKPFVLIRPMPQRDENGANIMGTASPGEFTIAYPTSQLSPRAHLDSATDPATRRLAADYRFQKAFAAAKAGTPIFMVEQALHKTRSTGVLYETMWRLPPEVDAAVLATKYHVLAQALGCKWCRVGVRNADDQGRQANHEEVRIIYGDPPSKVDLKDPTQKIWLETLEWETWWRECKIVNGNGHAPRLTTSQINHRGFTEVDFALPPGIEIEHCRKAVPAMSAASGYGYIEIEPDESGNPSLIHLVAGLKDPLNEQYLFVDYADHILSDPVAGQPNLDWAVGVGADGELMWYSWEAELPHLLLAGSSGQGKALALDTLIPTTVGMKEMGVLAVGDVVFDERGEPCTIVAATEIMSDRPCYEVEFDDGTVIVADANHQWFTETDAARASRYRLERYEQAPLPGWRPEDVSRITDLATQPDRLATIDEIAGEVGGHAGTIRALIKAHQVSPVRAFRVCQQQYATKTVHKRVRTFLYQRNSVLALLAARILEGRQSQDHKLVTGAIVTTEQIASSLYARGDFEASNHSVQVASPVQFPGLPGELPVDPYVLGVWLGDGGSWHGSVTSADPAIMEEVALSGYIVTDRSTRKGDACEYGVLGLKVQLRELGVLRNKHIPDVYLYASEKERWALLQGLMDTDGSVDEANGLSEFCNTNQRIANGVHLLLASLGIKARFRTEPAVLDGRVIGDRYRIAFTTSEPVFRLPRKTMRLPSSTRATRDHRYIVDVRPVASVPVRCIQVDSPSHQYLASTAFVPTHNSVLESSLLAQMLHNNDPLDLEIRCIEPKNELQAIQGFEHVTRFVDFNALAPGQSFFAAAADMLQDTVEEMERRYQLMTNHPQQPRKLSEARLIARDEPPPPGMDRHPFDLPYIVVVIEECGDIFRAPTLKAEKTDHERVLHQAELIARKARAAGIYMILVTQYPTNQNIPATIKNQTRRIGLAVSGQVASMVIIDEPGLEKITAKGRGMMSYGKGYRGFRALYLRRPSEEEPDLPDDFTAFTYDVPRHGGEIGDGGNTPRQAGVRRWPVPPPGIWVEQTV